MKLPTFIWNRENTERGLRHGRNSTLRMEGCGGLRIRVLWSDGRWTWPRSKAVRVLCESEWQILQ